LQEQGVSPGNYVGIVTESLSSFVIASIATMRIGATFVPFEPDFFKKETDPLAKFNIVNYWIIADSLSDQVSIERTRSYLKESQLQLIAKQSIGLVKSGLPDWNLIDSAAYVMYTSGTTGKPKGVLIPADGILKLHDEFRLKGWNDTTRVLCASNRGFDASTFEIWPTFLSGGTLIQASKDELLNPLRLNQVIKEFSLTAAWLTKTVFDLIVQTDPGALVGLQDLIIGGEPLSEKYVELFLIYAEGKVRLWNGYGPTETTTFATLDQLTLNNDGQINPIYIGTSLVGNTLYILGPDLEHLPKGCIGEAFISGAGVSLGYVGNEEATANSFLKDPYSCSGDDMMFKTGDFFEIIDYGVYRYIGRKDNLVKIKGFRVSTSTIQNTITRMEGIGDAAVLARNYTGRSQLVAFVCIRQDSITTPEDIRTYLSEQVSDYMVPSIIKIVDCIPINKNGKIDGDVLMNGLDAAARIEDDCNELLVNESNYVIILRDVWGIILGLDNVPLRQSLYVLGADSLGFVRCCILLAEHGISVTPQELIPFTTIVDQAAVVEDLATRQGLVRDSTSTLGHYQKLLYESRRYDKRMARAVYTSLKVEKEYDALAVGMALFRLFSIHPTLDVRQYMHNFYDRDDSSIRPIVVVELDNIDSTEELDRRAIAAVFSDLSLDIIPFKAFIGYGKDYNYLAIAIDNLVCSLAMIERIAKKASCWLSLESGLNWNWSLFYNVIDNKTNIDNTATTESNKDLDEASISMSSESLVHSSLTFIDLVSCYSEAIHWLKDQRGINYGRVFISTDGFLDTTKKETTTQSSMIIELGQFSDLSQLERSSINVLIMNRLRSQNSQVSAQLPIIDKLKTNDYFNSISLETPIHLLLSTNSIDRTRFISKSLCSLDLDLNGKLALLSASICDGEYLFTLEELTFPRKKVDVKGSEYLDKRTEPSLVQYLRNINGNTTDSRVCCISPLLDSISCFNELASATAHRLSLSGIYLRNNYSLPNAVEYIREAASEILKSFENSIPDVIVGYSLGGVIAAEVCALCECTLDVSPKLIIIDTLCPYTLQRSGFVFPEYNLISWANRVINLKLVLAGFTDKEIQKVHLNNIDNLSDVFGWMVQKGLISQQECLEGFYRYLQHGLIQYEAFKQYVPSRISADAVVVRASIQEPDVDSTLSRMNDLEYLGWSEFLDNKQEPLLIKGNHTSIVHGDSSSYNAEILASCISRLIDSL
jgi:amino acid adenylation domain-containing protein